MNEIKKPKLNKVYSWNGSEGLIGYTARAWPEYVHNTNQENIARILKRYREEGWRRVYTKIYVIINYSIWTQQRVYIHHS